MQVWTNMIFNVISSDIDIKNDGASFSDRCKWMFEVCFSPSLDVRSSLDGGIRMSNINNRRAKVSWVEPQGGTTQLITALSCRLRLDGLKCLWLHERYKMTKLPAICKLISYMQNGQRSLIPYCHRCKTPFPFTITKRLPDHHFPEPPHWRKDVVLNYDCIIMHYLGISEHKALSCLSSRCDLPRTMSPNVQVLGPPGICRPKPIPLEFQMIQHDTVPLPCDILSCCEGMSCQCGFISVLKHVLHLRSLLFTSLYLITFLTSTYHDTSWHTSHGQKKKRTTMAVGSPSTTSPAPPGRNVWTLHGHNEPSPSHLTCPVVGRCTMQSMCSLIKTPHCCN